MRDFRRRAGGLGFEPYFSRKVKVEMVSAWTGNGPVSVPPRSLAFGVGGALVLLAFVGVGLGLRAAWRESGAPDIGGATSASVGDADTMIAKPIVVLPTPAAATNAADNTASEAADNTADAIDVKTAEAQRIQSATAKSNPDIDQILASPSEKPTTPSKQGGDEAAPPGPPVKSDVPF
jgi:hypothetical protein